MCVFGVYCVESNSTVNDGFRRVQSKLERESFQRDAMTTRAPQTTYKQDILALGCFSFISYFANVSIIINNHRF